MAMQEISLPLVSVCTLTYNHMPYIRQCIEGVLMQRTTFPIELIVHDDASTDGTAGIIREYQERYPDIIISILQKENQYSKHIPISATYVWPKIRGKYVAICEGDDYWTDPLKLQKQVDYLEAHPDCGLVYTFAQTREKILNGMVGDYVSLLKGNKIPTLTVLFRSEHTMSYKAETGISLHSEKVKMGDYPMWLFISKRSRIHCLPEITSYYRVLDESASHSRNVAKKVAFFSSSLYVVFSFLKEETEEIKRDVLRKRMLDMLFYQMRYRRRYPEFLLESLDGISTDSVVLKFFISLFFKFNCFWKK